ncbi:Mu transposase domain-containing protein [Streptomyces sp. NPDC055709]
MAGLDQVVRKLGGTARRWRFDRMATVCYPTSGQVTAAFAAVAKYYGAGVDICPPRRGNRKGVVEKANHSAAQRWWRTVPDAVTVVQAQSGVDKLASRMDERRRVLDGIRTTVGELAACEPLLDIPTRPFPAELEVERTVSAQSLVSFDGNFYSVPPGLPGTSVKVVLRLGEDYLSIVTAGRAVIARHHRAPRGAGQTIRDAGHVIALEREVLAAFSDRAPCKNKVRRPPSQAALEEAERLRGQQQAAGNPAERVVIDLSHYAAVADRLRSVPPPKEETSE